MKSQVPSGQVRVGVVVRPLLPHEKEHGAEHCVKIINGKKVTFTHHPGNGITTSSVPQFDFDRAFAAAGTTQHKSIYDGLIAPLVDNVFEGYSATVFAYGQTGSGKTFVMGNGSNGNNTEGIIPSTVKGIFEKKSELEVTGSIVTLDMSYLEIYKEECFDLLAEVVGGHATGGDSSRNKLEMRDNTRGETVIEGLCSVTVISEEDVHRLLELAATARSTSKTAMNARSSRSHAIATFHVKIVTTTNNTDAAMVSTDSAIAADDQPMEVVAAATTTLTLCSKMHLVFYYPYIPSLTISHIPSDNACLPACLVTTGGLGG